jgi:hypothetical protein
MLKSLVALSILSAMSVSATAQTAPASNPGQPAKPQTIKKRVCEQVDENPYSRLGNRKICKTIEVPVEQPAGSAQAGQQAPAAAEQTGNNL